jgi:hypothetical protein
MAESNGTPIHSGWDASEVADASTVLQLSTPVLGEIVEKKVTCPFLGPALSTGQLPVRNEAFNPLASIEDVRTLGNTGGGDLGDLLAMFATGNHAFMRGSAGQLDREVSRGLFSLELPGSQGSHPGHSGILQGDPQKLGSGRLSQADFARLMSRAKDGLIKRSDFGRFIGENLFIDPKSKVFGAKVARILARDLGEFLLSTGRALLKKIVGSRQEADRAHRNLVQKLTRLLAENNLVGSAGEFGLLFAFLAHKPGARKLEGEPTVSVEDLRAMFLDKRFPNGWQNWKKRRLDWVISTTALLISAGKEYLALRRQTQQKKWDRG